MNFLRKNALLFIISIVLVYAFIETERSLLKVDKPYFTFLFLGIGIIVLVQALMYKKMKKVINKRFEEMKASSHKQGALNHSLMFAIEEIIDLQRADIAK